MRKVMVAGYDHDGFNSVGLDSTLHGRDGYNISGYDSAGFDRKGVHLDILLTGEFNSMGSDF